MLDVSRTKLTGDLANQLTQYSYAGKLLSETMSQPSAAADESMAFLNSLPTSRATTDTPSHENAATYVQICFHAQRTANIVYERLMDTILTLDDLAYQGDTIVSQNPLPANANLSNPQWGTAMMSRMYAAAMTIGGMMRYWQFGYLQQLMDAVTSEPDELSRLAMYAVLANTYNNWIDSITQHLGGAQSSWKLEISENVTPDSVINEVGRIPSILAQIPFCPGYRFGSSRSRAGIGDSLGEVVDTAIDKAKHLFVDSLSEHYKEGTVTGEAWKKNPSFSSPVVQDALLNDTKKITTKYAQKLGDEVKKPGFYVDLAAAALSKSGNLNAEAVGCSISLGRSVLSIAADGAEIAATVPTAPTGLGLVALGFEGVLPCVPQ